MKKIGNTEYRHIQYLPSFAKMSKEEMESILDTYDVFKIVKNRDGSVKTISFMACDDFRNSDEPRIVKSVIYDMKEDVGLTARKEYAGRGQIYHKKLLFFDNEKDASKYIDVTRAKIRDQWINYYVIVHPNYDPKKIGYEKFWNELICEAEKVVPFSLYYKEATRT